MKIYHYSLQELGVKAIDLGKRGENKVREIEFDLHDWIAEYPGASAALYVSQPNTTVYLATTNMVDGVLKWPIIDTYTAIPGFGDAEIVLSGADGERLKSVTASIFVNDSLSDGVPGEAPDYMRPYVDQVAENAAKVEEAVEEIKGIVVQSGNMPTGGTAGDALVKQSNAYGDAVWKALTAADVGALGKNETAADANKLNGKDASEYLLADDALNMDLLWENATPESNLSSGAQVWFDNGYEFVVIVFSLEVGSKNRTTALARLQADTQMHINAFAGIAVEGVPTMFNRLVFLSSNGMVFGGGNVKSLSATGYPTSDDSKMIPLSIYGIKGVGA